MNCLNCGHEVHKNYYGGYIHARQWQDHCANVIEVKLANAPQPIKTECGCTKPKGDTIPWQE